LDLQEKNFKHKEKTIDQRRNYQLPLNFSSPSASNPSRSVSVYLATMSPRDIWKGRKETNTVQPLNKELLSATITTVIV
jgi:hypothetical protein